MFLSNFPEAMFIQGAMFIPNSRVYKINGRPYERSNEFEKLFRAASVYPAGYHWPGFSTSEFFYLKTNAYELRLRCLCYVGMKTFNFFFDVTLVNVVLNKQFG